MCRVEFTDFRKPRQALDVGRTLTRFNFPQAEVFNPLGILLAHHLAQLDGTQRTATEGAENNNPGDDQPRAGVADTILAPLAAGTARGTLQPEPADDGGQGGESDDAGNGTVVRNSRRTDPTLLQGDVLVDSPRVGFTPGNLVFLTESFLDGEPGGTLEDQPSTINTVAEDRAEVGTSTQPNRLPEGAIITSGSCLGWAHIGLCRTAVDLPLGVGVSRAEGSEGHAELSGDATPVTPPTPIYHDPHPPFETDGRGRVVWSNSSQQARLRSRSLPPLQRRKSGNDETSTTKDKEGDGVVGPGIETEICGTADGDGGGGGRG